MVTRVFLTCWVLFSLHWSTNIVREHYPAFSLIEQGDFVLDRYAGFHSDIFEHTDGHHYIGNQVAGSVIAVPPLLLLDGVLDGLEARERARLEERGAPPAEYDTRYPNRARFFQRVREEGLSLRFGASAAITSVFVMAPLSALLVVLVLRLLLEAGVERRRAAWLALLFALATPVFYRAAHLNHNVFLTLTVFASFLAVWRRPRHGARLPLGRAAWGGFFGGCCLALDYAGVVPLLIFFAHLLWDHRSERKLMLRAGAAYVLASVPPVVFLCATQWAMYGHPFLPGQWWMPEVNYTDAGWRGFGLPDADVMGLNLFGLDYGLFPFAPLLALALWPRPLRSAGGQQCGWPGGVALAGLWTFVGAFLLFCAANQYSRMQWNSGFRYLLPLVPFLFLLAAPVLSRMPRWILVAISVPAVLHGWVLSMHRYTPPDRLNPLDDAPSTIEGSWRLLAERGVEFPWLNVLRSTFASTHPVLQSPWLVVALCALAAASIVATWRLFRRRPEEEPRS